MPPKKRGSGLSHRKGGRFHARRRGGITRSTSGDQREGTVTPDSNAGSDISYAGSEISSASSFASEDPTGDECIFSSQFQGVSEDVSASPASNIAGKSSSPATEIAMKSVSPATEVAREQLSPQTTDCEEACRLFHLVLPMYWRVIRGHKGFHLVCISKGDKNISVQREVFVSFSGGLEVFVHTKPLNDNILKDVLKEVPNPEPLTATSVKHFVDTCVKIVLSVARYEICAGADQAELEFLWSSDESGIVDNNPYQEPRYVKTFRSRDCCLLIPVRNWTCGECKRVIRRLKQKHKNHFEDKLTFKGRNTYLDAKQLQAKLAEQRRELKNARRKIDYLQNRVGDLIKVQGVVIDKDDSEALSEILKESKLTPVQQLFIQQQYKMSTLKGATRMRWHPTMIRFALLIKSTSSAAYSAIASSGVIRLPSQRTLFDFEHAIPRSEGIFFEKLSIIGKNVKNLDREHQHIHSLLMDEIHISQKLVYRKSDGSLVGFVKLNEVEVEMESLLQSIKEGKVGEVEPAVATKVLAYMVKGCTNSVKEVVAAFPVASLSKEQLFDRTWKVISACEEDGLKILAVVCDGSSVNRAFFKMHTPATPCSSNVIFDTINQCAFNRTLYFISDPPHLIKTIRNCFAKSGSGSKCTRLLFKNNEFIQWKTTVRLYKEDMHSNLRRSYKLNAQNVYLNSYSCMKVAYAAQVLSKTVGMDLKDRNWPGTAATVELILKVNNFFDNLNGAHTSQANKTANPRLEAYRDVDDPRFAELKEFEDYILNWQEEVKNLNGFTAEQKAKMTLSPQTVEGIYVTVNGFCGAVTFLLGIGASFVNGRAFCQDPLEQYFGKQRASGGGRVNPTVSGFLTSDVKISVHRDVNVRKRSGNTETFLSAMEVDDEALHRRPKRRRSF